MNEGSGSIPLTNGSGSERAKNMWIRWIHTTNNGIQIQIRYRYLEKYFDAVDEEKDDDNKHESGIAAVEDVGVIKMVLIKKKRQAIILKYY
jgi:hypothetical protein